MTDILIYVVSTFVCLHCRTPICGISTTMLVGRNSGGNKDDGGPVKTLRSLNVFSVAGGFSGRIRVLGSEALVGGIIGRLGLCVSITRRHVFNCGAPLCGSAPMGICVAPRRTSGLRRKTGLRLGCAVGKGLSMGIRCVFSRRGRRARMDFSDVPTIFPAPMKIFDFAGGSSIPPLRRSVGLITCIGSPASIARDCMRGLSIRPASGAAAVTTVDLRGAMGRHNVSFVGYLISFCGLSTGSRGGRITRGSTRFVSRHVNVVGQRLNATRARLTSFGRHSKLASLADSTHLTLRRDSGCRRRLARGTARLELIRSLHGCIGGPGGTGRIVPTGMKLRSRGLNSVVGRCGAVLVRHGHLLHASSRGGPTMVGVGANVRSVQRGIRAAIGDMLEKLRVTRSGLRHRTQGFRNEVDDTPRRRGRFLAVSHRRRVGTALCVVLLRGHRRGTVALTSATGGKHVVGTTLPDGGPISPGGVIIVLITLMLNVNVPMNLVCLGSLLGCGVRGTRSIRGVASIPVLNRLPLDGGPRGNTVIIRRGRGNVVRRTFHNLHAGVLFVLNTDRGIILFASARPNRNGSFVTKGATIDLTCVNGGIIVINLSVHGPKLGGIFGLSRHARNVAGCLTSPRRAGLFSVVRRSSMDPGLSVLPNNPVPPGPARLVTHAMLRSTVRGLGRHCSCVVLSATPVTVIASATVTDHITSVYICIYHTSMAPGLKCRCVGILQSRGGFSGLTAIVGDVSLGSEETNCNCKRGCNCKCNCNVSNDGG